MPRAIAEVNAIRRSNQSVADGNSPGQPPGGGHGGHAYDPNQPRVPAGHSDGGRWTSKPGGEAPGAPNREVEIDESGEEAWESVASAYRPDGTLAGQEVINRDGSRIVSQFSRDPRISGWDERHTVTLPDGQQLTFENSGDTQTIYDADGRPVSASTWTGNGPEPEAIVQPAFVPAVPLVVGAGAAAARATVQAALVLGTWLASRNGPGGRTVVSFSPTMYEPNADPKKEPMWVGPLSEKEFTDTCKRHAKVQSFTDRAAAEARSERSDWTPQGFGTEVHKRVAREVNGKDKNGEFRSPNDPQDKNFVAELSAYKIKAADADGRAPGYGGKGTIRVDVLEHYPDKRIVCVYDIKTGERGLLPGRIKEIIGSVVKHFGNAVRIIITEVRPYS